MSKFTTLRDIFSHLITVRKNWPIITLFLLLYVALTVSGPYFYKLVIDGLEGGIATGKVENQLIITLVSWIFVILATIGVHYFFVKTFLIFTNKDWFNFMLKSIRILLYLPIDYHISNQHGEKQKTIDRACEAVWNASDIIIGKIIPQILIMFFLLLSGLWISWKMTLLTLLFLPIVLIGVNILGKKAYQNQKAADTYWDKLFNRVSDTFSNLKVIRIFAREQEEMNILNERAVIASENQNHVRNNWIILNSFGGVVSILAQAITISGGIYLLINKDITLGTLFFFIAFTDRIYAPIFDVFHGVQYMIQQIASYEKMQALFGMKPEVDEGKKEFKGIKDFLSMEGVSFSYPSSTRKVLSYINIKIRKGERIALIGHTGSGKSTIIQLLMRFYDPTSGTIRIDDYDVRDYSLGSYRSKFSSVFQDTTLFNDTIKHNLEYVRDGLTMEQIRSACEKANILDFIESLPEKWETQVGERGLKLSGGEKQRIAIARAILTDPEILILDEATSALDTETERLIQDSLETLMADRTSIVIAHRLSTIKHVNTIYLLEGGKIIASGSHRSLLRTNAQYKHMVELQHGGFIADDEEESMEEEINSSNTI